MDWWTFIRPEALTMQWIQMFPLVLPRTFEKHCGAGG